MKALIFTVFLLLLLSGCGSSDDSSSSNIDPSTGSMKPMANQTYALCAGAQAFNFDGVTYAKCRIKNGNSIADAHAFPGGDAITVNQQLTSTGTAMVSTYSPPDQSVYALYECTQNGAFAQCNGGLCNRYNGIFPGVGAVSPEEIMCSCPITYKTSTYHVTGPAECPTTQAAFDSICGAGSQADMTADGTILYIGAGGPPSATIDGLNVLYDQSFGTQTPKPPICTRPAQ